MQKKLTSFSILAILTAVMVLLMFITIYQAEDNSDDFKPLYPDLAGQLGQVNKLTFNSPVSGEYTLLRGEEREDWRLVEHYNYPADYSLLRRMMVDIADATILEQKTDNPEQYPLLEVAAIEDGGQGLEISFYRDDELISGLILGRERGVPTQTGLRQFFVRRSGEAQSWLVEGYLQFSPSMLNWINGEVINIERERIAQVEIKQPSGETATLVNLGEKDKFGTPEAREATVFRYEQLGYDIAGALHQLRLEDVQPVEDFSRGDAEVVQAEFLTYDGLKVISKTSFNDGFYYSTFSAEFDDAAMENVPAAIADLDALKTAEQVQAEVAALNERLSPWVYRVGGFVGTNMMRARQDIVTERESVIPMPRMPGS